jgi:hypothetical protein
MNSKSTNIDAINTSNSTNADYNTNNTQNKNATFNYAADNKCDNLRQGVSRPAETPSTNTDSFERDSVSRETESCWFEGYESRNRDSNTDETDKDGVPKKGIAGVIHSKYGGEKTTTSTFEKSQGEKYGEGFDETGAQLQGRFSVDESAAASGSGGGEYAMGGKQGVKAGRDTNVLREHGSHNGSLKESFGHRLMDKAGGIHPFTLPQLSNG